tara:strand:+ start:423 stop:1298 length:876 start_codon:yes stop_codon:yes gene_type:complete
LSRNKDRTGASNPDASVPVAPTAASSAAITNEPPAGFSFVVPTEFVELPSEGKFYPPDHPLHGQDSIEIKQMTAKEEDLLTSQTLLKKGVAVDRLLKSLIVDKRINPDTLFVGDRNAMLIAVRVSGYGSEYTTKITCPACNTTDKYSFDLNTINMVRPGDASELGVTNNNDGTFNTTLPATGLDIKFRLLLGNDERNVLNGLKSDRKQKIHERAITRQLKNFIVSVNGNSTAEAINYVISNMPAIDSRHLRLAYKLTAPNVDLTQVFICPACDHQQDMEVPLTADFFWPDR